MFQRLTEAYTMSQSAPPVADKTGVVEITLEHAFRGGPAVVQSPTDTVYIDIPQGADDRETITVNGQTYQVRMTNDTKFVRKGIHLYYTHFITLREALGGFVFVLDHLDGSSLRITKENGEVVQPGQKKTIPHHGMRRGGACGDLIVTFELVLPSKLTPDQRDALKYF